jgi:hypothetical protein
MSVIGRFRRLRGWEKIIVAFLAFWLVLALVLFVIGVPTSSAAVPDGSVGGLDASAPDSVPYLTDAQKTANGYSTGFAVGSMSVGAEPLGTLANTGVYYDASRRENCRIYTRIRSANGPLGVLFRLYMQVHFCWVGHKLTFAPASHNWRKITQYGAIGQWESDGSDRWDAWHLTPHTTGGNDFAGHAVAAYFKRCIPSPWGCVKVGAYTLRLHLVTYAGGHIEIVE